MKIKKWEDLDGVKNEEFKLLANECDEITSIEINRICGLWLNTISTDRYSKTQLLGILKAIGFDIEFEAQPKLTNQEWHLVRGFDGWVAKDEQGGIFVYESKPEKLGSNGMWQAAKMFEYKICIKENVLPFIKWEDEEPWTSEELRKLGREEV